MATMIIVAVILLGLHFWGRNAVWGGATIGVVIGLVVALVTKDWGWLATFFALGTFVGTFAEWLGRLGDYLKRRSQTR